MTAPKEDIYYALVAGRLYLEEFGWVRGAVNYREGNGPCCVMGAVRHAIRSDLWACFGVLALYRGAWDELALTLGDNNLMGWNDTVAKSARQVKALFDKTIKRLEKEVWG